MGDQLEDGSGCVSASLEEWFQDVAVDAQSATSTETQQELNVAAEPVTLPSFLAPSEPADLPDLDSVSPGGLEEPDGQGCKSSDDSALWGWKVFSFAPSIPNCADSRSRRFRPLARPRPQTEDLLLGTLTEEDASDIEGGELVSKAVVETESTDRNVEGGTRKGDMSGPSPHSLEPPPHLISNSRQTSESGHLMDWREVRRRESLSSYEQHRSEALIPRNLTPSLALDELRKKDVVIEALRRTVSVMECDFRREIAAWQKQLQTERERAEVAQKTIQMMSQQEAVFKAELAKMTEARFRGMSASSERIRQAEADAKTACGWVESLAQVVRTARASEAKAVSSMGILQGDKLMAEGKLRQAEWELGELREREMEFASLMEEKEQREKDLLKRLEEKEKEEMDLRNRLGEKDKREADLQQRLENYDKREVDLTKRLQMQTTELTQCQRFLKNKEDQNFSLQLRLGESQQKEKQTLKWLNLLLEERRGKDGKCTQQSGQKECVSDPSGSHVLVGSPPGQSPQVRLHLPPSSAKTNPEAQSLHWSSDQQPEGGAAASSDIQLSKLSLYRQALSQAAPKQTSLPSTGEQAPSVSLSEKVEGVPVSGPVPSPSPSTWKGGEEAARKGEEVRVSDEKEERPNDDKPLPDTEKKEKEGKDGDSLKRPTHEEGTQPNETETEKEPERLPTPNPGKGVHEQPAPKPTYMYPPPYAPPFPSPYPTHLPLGGLHIIRSTAPPAPQPAFPYPPPTPPTLYYPPVPTSHQIPHPVAPPVVLAQPAQSLPHVSTHGRTPSDARGSTTPFL